MRQRVQFRCGVGTSSNTTSPVCGSRDTVRLLCADTTSPRTAGSKPSAYSSSTVPGGNCVTVSSHDPSANSSRTQSRTHDAVLSTCRSDATTFPGNCTAMPSFSGFSIPLVNGELTFSPDGVISIPTKGYRIEQVSPYELRFHREEGVS